LASQRGLSAVAFGGRGPHRSLRATVDKPREGAGGGALPEHDSDLRAIN
jgi:hypothetical protein